MILFILCLSIITICFFFIINKSYIINDNNLSDDIDDLIKNSLSGEKYDNSAESVIKKTKQKKHKTAEDYYNIGTIYACHKDDPLLAADYYNQMLDEVKKGNINFNEVTNLLYSLESIIKKNPVFKNDIMLVDNFNDTVQKTNKILSDPKINNKIKNRIKNKINWKSDWQNVHDSHISDDIVSQIRYLISSNNEESIDRFKIEQIEDWINNHSKYNTTNVLTRIKENAPLPYDNIFIGESELLCELWRRAHARVNISRKNDILLAIIQSLDNCIEKGIIVCLTGRITRLVSSLAVTDAESESKNIGILKTKTMMRNEIFDKCAAVVKFYTDGLSNTNKHIIHDYNKGISNDDVTKLEDEMKQKVKDIIQQYHGKMDNSDLLQISDECISSI